jgi:hypothetical protein
MLGLGERPAGMHFDVPIPINRQDEIGDMRRAFVIIRDELKKMYGLLKRNSAIKKIAAPNSLFRCNSLRTA